MPKKSAAEVPVPAESGQPDAPVDLDRPRKLLKPDQFFRAIAEYPQKDGICVYIYRRWPVIDSKLIDPNAKTHIDKVAEPIDEAYLARHWGNGEYKLKFTDENRPRGSTEVCQAVVTVNEPDLMPVIEDPRTIVLEHPLNRSYVKMMRIRGLLPKEGEEVPTPKPETGSSELANLASEIVRGQIRRSHDPAESVQNRALDLMAEASKEAIRIASSQAKPSDPIEQFLKLKEALRPADDSSLLKLLFDAQQKHLELMVEQMRAAQKPQGGLEDELAKFDRLTNIFEKFSGRGGSRSNLWETLLQFAPAILDPVSRMVQAWAGARGGTPAPAPPAPRAELVPLPTPAISNPIPSEGADMPIPPALVGQLGNALTDALARGVSGDEFAESLCNVYGEALYDRVAQLGQPAILNALRSVPALWAQLDPIQDQVEQFVADFLAYGQPAPPAATEQKAA